MRIRLFVFFYYIINSNCDAIAESSAPVIPDFYKIPETEIDKAVDDIVGPIAPTLDVNPQAPTAQPIENQVCKHPTYIELENHYNKGDQENVEGQSDLVRLTTSKHQTQNSVSENRSIDVNHTTASERLYEESAKKHFQECVIIAQDVVDGSNSFYSQINSTDNKACIQATIDLRIEALNLKKDCERLIGETNSIGNGTNSQGNTAEAIAGESSPASSDTTPATPSSGSEGSSPGADSGASSPSGSSPSADTGGSPSGGSPSGGSPSGGSSAKKGGSGAGIGALGALGALGMMGMMAGKDDKTPEKKTGECVVGNNEGNSNKDKDTDKKQVIGRYVDGMCVANSGEDKPKDDNPETCPVNTTYNETDKICVVDHKEDATCTEDEELVGGKCYAKLEDTRCSAPYKWSESVQACVTADPKKPTDVLATKSQTNFRSFQQSK